MSPRDANALLRSLLAAVYPGFAAPIPVPLAWAIEHGARLPAAWRAATDAETMRHVLWYTRHSTMEPCPETGMTWPHAMYCRRPECGFDDDEPSGLVCRACADAVRAVVPEMTLDEVAASRDRPFRKGPR